MYKKLASGDDSINIEDFKLPEVDYSLRNKRFGFLPHLLATYDQSVLLIILLNNFNNGAYSMILMVIVNMFQEEFIIGAAQAQIQVAWIALPFVFGFVYGLFSESIPICGSRKKSYLLIMSFLEVASCITVVLLPVTTQAKSIQLTCLALSFCSFSLCWLDTIVDGLVVVEQRKDPLHGSQDIQVFSMICLAFGGIIPNLLAIIFSVKLSLSLCYTIPMMIGVVLFIASLFLSKEADKTDDEFLAWSFEKRVSFQLRAFR